MLDELIDIITLAFRQPDAFSTYSIVFLINFITLIILIFKNSKISTYKKAFLIELLIPIFIGVIISIVESFEGASAFTGTIYGVLAFQWTLFGLLLHFWPTIIFSLIVFIVAKNIEGHKSK